MEERDIKNIKKKLMRGDRAKLARMAKCSVQTVDFTFSFKRKGPKSDIVIKKSLELLEEREQIRVNLLKKYNKLYEKNIYSR